MAQAATTDSTAFALAESAAPLRRSDSDAALIERVRGGDRWAADTLFRRHVDPIMGLVTRLLGSRDEAQDVVQDAFLTAFTRADQLQDPSSFRPWLSQIAVREVHRRFRRGRMLRALGLESSPPDATLETFADSTATAEDRTELGLLDDVLRKLPPVQRTAWMLRYVEQHTLEEVAELCGCSLSAAKRRIAAAQGRVRKHLQERGGAHA